MTTLLSSAFAATSKGQAGGTLPGRAGRVPPMPDTAMFPEFREIWLVDFEFEFGGSREQGELPRPICLVAREFRSGRIVRQWRNEFGPRPPYPTDPGALFVAYY